MILFLKIDNTIVNEKMGNYVLILQLKISFVLFIKSFIFIPTESFISGKILLPNFQIQIQ